MISEISSSWFFHRVRVHRFRCVPEHYPAIRMIAVRRTALRTSRSNRSAVGRRRRCCGDPKPSGASASPSRRPALPRARSWYGQCRASHVSRARARSDVHPATVYGALRAVIEIPVASDYAELIGHELEHVIEHDRGHRPARSGQREGSDVVEVAERRLRNRARDRGGRLAATPRGPRGTTDDAVSSAGRQTAVSGAGHRRAGLGPSTAGRRAGPAKSVVSGSATASTAHKDY